MRLLKLVRFLTYAVLVVIAVLVTRQRYFIEVQFEPEHFVSAPALSTWRGQSEGWLRGNLTSSHLVKDILVESSSLDVDPQIRSALLKAKPGYSGYLRHMIWVRDLGGWKIRQHEVYLFKDDKEWLILDVSEKDEQMTG